MISNAASNIENGELPIKDNIDKKKVGNKFKCGELMTTREAI